MSAGVLVCFGTRPEVVKLAPVVHELERRGLPVACATTGQHREMLDQMLDAFGIEPDLDLRLMEAHQSLAGLTGRAVPALAEAIGAFDPAAVLVQGDTTTAMCAALAAFYRQVPVGHVEAGLRTRRLDSPFPEEANRQIVGRLSRWHFCPTSTARDHLLAEAIDPAGIEVTGNTVIDAARWIAAGRGIVRASRPGGRRTVLVTMHRRESRGEAQRGLARMLARLAERDDVHVVFPVHLSPAVRATVLPELEHHPGVTLCEPLGYPDFIAALASADLVLTDSGGVQEEAPAFDVPVLVMRDTTERPEGVEAGCAVLCGTDPDVVFKRASRLLDDPALYARMAAARNPFGDGHAARRVVARLEDDLFGSPLRATAA